MAIQSAELPKKNSDWKKNKAEVMKIFDSYSAARAKLEKSTVTSELSDTDCENLGTNRYLRTRKDHPEPNSNVPRKKCNLAGKELVRYSSISCQDVIAKENDRDLRQTKNFGFEFAAVSFPNEIDAGTIPKTPEGNVIVHVEPFNEGKSIEDVQQNQEFQGKLLEYLADVKLKLERLETKVDLINQSSLASAALDETGFEDLSFSDHKKLEIFKRSLDADKMLKLKAVERFSSFGGRKPSLHVAAILSDILTDELAKCYSLCGLRGNRNFSELGFLKIIYVSVKKAAKHAAAITREDIRSSMDSWLRHANDRISLKSKKLNSQKRTEESSSEDEI